MKRLSENLKRTGLKGALVTASVLNWKPEKLFDIIVLDAPCSATGTIRRHPDLPHVRKDVDLKPLLTLQARMIARAFGWLKPEGRLLYCTCSLVKAEGEAHLEKLVGKGFKSAGILPKGAEKQWLTDTGALRLRPDYWQDQGGMDGFFAGVLQKPA
jgi:16S rRNA (cytosine967-C5)-methyltransferase